jgi:hypothetical protein
MKEEIPLDVRVEQWNPVDRFGHACFTTAYQKKMMGENASYVVSFEMPDEKTLNFTPHIYLIPTNIDLAALETMVKKAVGELKPEDWTPRLDRTEFIPDY